MLSKDDFDRVSFTIVRWREGYEIDEVDAFLLLIRSAIMAGPSAAPSVTAADVVSIVFQPTKFRPGYMQFEVDAFLDKAAGTLLSYGK